MVYSSIQPGLAKVDMWNWVAIRKNVSTKLDIKCQWRNKIRKGRLQNGITVRLAAGNKLLLFRLSKPVKFTCAFTHVLTALFCIQILHHYVCIYLSFGFASKMPISDPVRISPSSLWNYSFISTRFFFLIWIWKTLAVTIYNLCR